MSRRFIKTGAAEVQDHERGLQPKFKRRFGLQGAALGAEGGDASVPSALVSFP